MIMQKPMRKAFFSLLVLLFLVALTSLPLCCRGFLNINPQQTRFNIRKSSRPSFASELYSSLQPEIQIKTKQIELSTGINAEIMTCKPPDDKTPLSSLQMIFTSKPKPPLVFIHGSFHASWCWAEKFFPFFADLGYPCYAISLRGTGGTFAGEEVKRVKIMDHVSDITSFLEYVSKKEEGGQPPVLLAHSFGGLAIMKYLEKYLHSDPNESDGSTPEFLSDDTEDCDDEIDQPQLKLPVALSGICLMCSVPPSGNGRMTMRFLRRSLKDSWKITAGLALKKCITNEKLCRELFFGGDIVTMDRVSDVKGNIKSTVVEDWGVSEEDIKRYQGYFERDTVATISLKDLAKKLPSSNIDKDGKALFVDAVPPSLVLGALDDFIVDNAGVVETANYFGVEPLFVDSPHDVMLGSRWKNAAKAISQWLETI